MTNGKGQKNFTAGFILFGLIWVLIGLFFLLMGTLFTFMPTQNMPESFFRYLPMGMMFVMSAVFLWLGVGSVLARRWARALILILSWYWLVSGLFGICFFAYMMPQMMNNIPQMNSGALESVEWVMGIFGIFVYVLLPGGFVLFYGSASAKNTCETKDVKVRWTDKVPIPILGTSMICAFWALICLALTPLGMFPIFGMMLKGLEGIGVLGCIALVLLGLSWGIYRMKMAAWWTALVVTITYNLSTILTFGFFDMADMFKQAGVKAEQFQFLQKESADFLSVVPYEMGAIAIVMIGFMIWLKKFFKKSEPAFELPPEVAVDTPRMVVAPPPVAKEKPPAAPAKKTPLWQLVLVSVLFATLFSLAYVFVQEKINEKQQAELAAQRKAEAEALPHQQIHAKIQDLIQHGTALPPCPLVYPLLDKKGHVTPLGSYLSYFSMKQASYLPKTVFCIPNAGEIFNEFDLFTANSPKQKAYKDQLPYYFGNVKDFGEGKLLKTGSSYKIQLRFWGTRPQKKYSKVFKKGKLHLAISWMAASLQDYMGFKADAAQKAYRDKPIFVEDKDLLRGARLETVFRNNGDGLIMGWENILAKNPDNPYLFDRWLAILDSRGGQKHLAMIQDLVKKDPNNTFSKLDYLVQASKAEQYDEGIDVGFQELSRDDNDPDWYDLIVNCLEWKGFYVEAIDLLNAWTKLHPDNQEAWMKLKDVQVEWAWVARGSGWASTVTEEGRRLMNQRIGDAIVAGTRAAQIAPGDGRVWSKLLSLGTGAEFEHDRMNGYFQKMFKTNPYRTQGYDTYLNYLKPKWFGSEEEMLDLGNKYDAYDPGLLAAAYKEIFQVYEDSDSDEAQEARLKAIREKMKDPAALKAFEKSAMRYLTIHPEDMNAWNDLMGWEDLAGHQKKVFDAAKKLSQSNPELSGLPSAVFLGYVQAAQNNIVGQDEKEKFEQRPDIVKGSEQAYQKLADLDSGNWDSENALAFYAFKQHDLLLTQKALKTIKDNWSPEVWPKDIFDKAVSLCQKESDDYWSGVPCPNHCLQLETGDWIHMHVNGHPDSDIWQKFYDDNWQYQAWSQHHVGQLIKKVNGHWVDQGECPVCHGKGWVKKDKPTP